MTTVSVKKSYQSGTPGQVAIVADEIFNGYGESQVSVDGVEPQTIAKKDFQKFAEIYHDIFETPAYKSYKFTFKVTGLQEDVDALASLIAPISEHSEL